MEKNKITNLFEDVSLYEKKEFLIYDENEEFYGINIKEIANFYSYLGIYNEENLITKCYDCDNCFPFKMEIEVALFNYFEEKKVLKLGESFSHNSIVLDFNKSYSFKKIISNLQNVKLCKESIKDNIIFLYYRFTCTNNKNHIYNMLIAVKNYDKKIIVEKVGQYPDKTILGEYECFDYKNILNKLNNCFEDYFNSEKSYKCGLYVGAYTYLRRVFEKMLNYYLKKENIDEKSVITSKAKIDKVSKYYDEAIRDYLYPEYDILSKGVHNLDEQTCKKNYDEIKYIINMQLSKEKVEKERKKKMDNSKNVIEALRKEFSNK